MARRTELLVVHGCRRNDELQDKLVRELGVGELANRALLLQAAVSKDKLQDVFTELTAGFNLGSKPVSTTTTPTTTVGQCTKGHLLAHFDTPTSNFTCDLCAVRAPQNVPMYGCRECDFDVCSSCFGGNALHGSAIRPSMRFSSVLSEVLTNVSLKRDEVFSKLTEHAMGVLFSLTAAALFQPSLLAQDEDSAVSKQCAEVFSPTTVKGRLNLRALCEAMSPGAALIALSRFAEDECILKLILADLRSGSTKEDQDQGLHSSQHAFGHDSAFLPHLTSSQLLRLGAMKKPLAMEDWFSCALLLRALPHQDEADSGDFSATASAECKLRRLAKLKQVADSLKKKHDALDFLLLHHQVKLDRARRRPLLPHSLSLQHDAASAPRSLLSGSSADTAATTAQTNLPLLLEYLQVVHRPSIMPKQPGTLARDLNSDALCAVLGAYFPMPTPSEDVELISKEMLDVFAWKEATAQTFLPMLESRFVHDLLERKPAPSSACSISFCDFNPSAFPASQQVVELTCEFQNLSQVHCKVFEIDATRVLRKTKRAVTAGINLDGLVPHREFPVHLGSSSSSSGGGLQRERIKVLDSDRVGLFVVEIVGNGMATRALVQRGAIRAVQTKEPFGHVFFPFELDPSARMVMSGAELWVEGKVYLAEADGRIVVPFAPEGEGALHTAVLSHQSRAHLFTFWREPAAYTLTASLSVDRESLLAGNREAQIAVHPSLLMAGEPAPLSLLREVTVVVDQTDALGTSTQQTFVVPEWTGDDTLVRHFKVVPNLALVSAHVTAKIAGKPVPCGNSLKLPVNTCHDRVAVHMRPKRGGGFELLVLGRTGEPVRDFPLVVNFSHESSTTKVPWACTSNAEGEVDLGDLSQVTEILVSHSVGPGFGDSRQRTFQVPRPIVLGRLVRQVACSENDLVQYIFPLASRHVELTGREFALVDQQTKQHLFASHLSLHAHGTHVYVANLKPGDYVFHYFSPREHVEVEIAVSAAVGQLSRDGVLRLPLQGNSRVFAARPKQHAVCISQAKLEGSTVSVAVQGGSTQKRRVHAVFRTLLPANSQPYERQWTGESAPQWFHLDPALYVPMRKLNEEIVYCMDRVKLGKTSGNRLPQPTLLMHPVDLGVTVSQVVDAKEGGAMPKAGRMGMNQADMLYSLSAQEEQVSTFGGGGARMMMKRMAAPGGRNSGPPHNPVQDANLDFLPAPSRVLANLQPDAETGLVRFTLPEHCSWVEIVAVDGQDSCVLPLFVPSSAAAVGGAAGNGFKDLGHRIDEGLGLEDHIVEQQSATRVARGQEFVVGNFATAKFAVLDTLQSHVDFAKAASPILGEQAFDAMAGLFLEWHTLSAADKLAKYAAKACHELNFFLKQRDAEFFNAQVRPQLMDKPEHLLVERLLLGEDGGAEEYVDRWDLVDKLQAVECAMLAVAVRESHPGFSQALLRLLKDGFEAQPVDVVETARARLFQLAVQLDNGGALDAATAAPPPPRPMMAMASAPVAAGGFFGSSGSARPQQQQQAHAFYASSMMSLGSADIGADIGAAEEEVEDADGGDADVVARMTKLQAEAVQSRYKPLGPAHQWCESQFADGQQTFSCQALNVGFWYDWAANQGSAFLSPDLCLAERTGLSESLFMLGAITGAVVGESVKHEYTDLTFTPQVDCVVFHSQIDKFTGDASGGEDRPILVDQKLFDVQELDRGVEREPIELVQQRVYVIRTVITNVSSTTCRVKLLVQIPEHALGLDGLGRQVVTLTLSAFTTQQHLSCRFYFPQPVPQSRWFPAHVSLGGDLVAFASPARTLEVKSELTQVDVTSWVHVASPTATIEQVVSFLRKAKLGDFNLRDIVWRCQHSKSDWLKLVECVEARGVFSPDLLAFALLHGDGDDKRISQVLTNRYAAQVGPRFASKYVSVAARAGNAAEWIPEVFPLVNARAHPLVGQTSANTNSTVAKAHQRLVSELVYSATPVLDGDRLRVAVLLVEQGRIALAKQLVRKIRLDSIQAQYMRVYLSFYLEEGGEGEFAAQEALDMAERYVEAHPNPQWRDRFAAVARACRIVLGLPEPVSTAPQAVTSSPSSSSSSFEIEFNDRGQLEIAAHHLGQGAQFQIKVFKTNVEYLFSTKPFAMLGGGGGGGGEEEQCILPNYSCQAVLEQPAGELLVVDLPSEVVANQNILVQVSHQGKQRTATHFTCAIKAQFSEQTGVVRCLVKGTAKPLSLAYCKVYARTTTGAGKHAFHKDGYTDVCGEFDYCGINTGSLDQVVEFAVLVSHPDFGALVRRVARPVLL